MAGNWKEPEFDFSERSDRVTLKLEVGQVVYIPGAADIRNENTDQAELKSMSKEERILEYIRQNGNIFNAEGYGFVQLQVQNRCKKFIREINKIRQD